MSILDNVENPEVLKSLATIVAFLPAPEGPMAAAALRLAAAWIQSGLDTEAVNAIVAKYSAEAQKLADNW